MNVIKSNWNYQHINIRNDYETKYNHFELQINNLCQNVLKDLEEGFSVESIYYQANIALTYDEELKQLIESNKELKQDIDTKIKDLAKQQTQYENFKQDQKLLAQEIKDTHEAFLMAKKFYKKFLKIYYTIESRNNKTQVVFIQFFTEAKKDTEDYSVRLSRNLGTGRYGLHSINPELQNFKELQRKLEETNDVPGVLYCLRKAFKAIKDSKKKQPVI